MRALLPLKQNRQNIMATLLAGLMFTHLAIAPLPALAEQTPLKGSVVQSTGVAGSQVNEDDIREIEAGTDLEMTVTTALTPAVSVEGDEFFAKITKDYEVNGKVVIPKGTLCHGVITEAEGPRRAGRNSYIMSKFDYLITPDGREIPIEGNFSTKKSKAKTVAKVVGRSAGFTAVGGAVGALMVLKYGGLAAIAASNGYALAGGAAIGGAAGLVSSLVTKGKYKMIQPGAELKIKLQEGLSLPTMDIPDESAQNFAPEGLNVDVLGMQIGKDPFGEPTEITLSLDMVNQTEHTFTFFDIALQDEFGSLFYPSAFGDTALWFRKFKPNTKMTGNLSFSVDSPRETHYLVFFKRYTREPVAKIAITGDMQADKKTVKERVKTASAENYSKDN